MTTKMPSVLNWRSRYALAPSCTAPAISCIFLVPLPAAENRLDQGGREAERHQRDDRGDDHVGQVLTGKGQLAGGDESVPDIRCPPVPTQCTTDAPEGRRAGWSSDSAGGVVTRPRARARTGAPACQEHDGRTLAGPTWSAVTSRWHVRAVRFPTRVMIRRAAERRQCAGRRCTGQDIRTSVPVPSVAGGHVEVGHQAGEQGQPDPGGEQSSSRPAGRSRPRPGP